MLTTNVAATFKSSHSRKQDVDSARADHPAQFYKDYRKVAEEFLKNHSEELNTTLISVSYVRYRFDERVLMF